MTLDELPERLRRINLNVVTINVLLTIVIAIGIGTGRLDSILGVILLLFGSLIVTAVHHLLRVLNRGDSFGVESSLPSLDGSEGGWRLSASLTILILIVALAVTPIFVYSGIKNAMKDDGTRTDSTSVAKQPAKPTTKADTTTTKASDTTKVK